MSSRSRRRYALLAALTVAITVAGMMLVLLGVDVYLHRKYEQTALVNVWGYRGPTVGRKQPGEIRVVVLGGSTAFGYGPYWNGAFPYLLEKRLNATGRGRFSVVNLGFNNEGAYSLRYTLEDYEYLDYDIAILYEGYNDLGPEPRYQVFRRDSAIFRLTGYLPVFPLVAKEKAYVLLYGGNISEGYRTEGKTVFRPGLVTRATATTLQAAVKTAESLEHQLGRLSADTSSAFHVSPAEGCSPRWQHYCGAMYDAVTWARRHGTAVIVGSQPFLTDEHVAQQNSLANMLAQRFGADPEVRYVNLGRAIDVHKQRDIAYDGVHLTAEGNDIIASHFVQPVLDLMAQLASR